MPPVTPETVQPGMWAVVDTGSQFSGVIKLAEGLATRRRPSRWDHAVTATRWVTSGLGGRALMIAEAEPGGAVERPWHYENRPYLWSPPGLWHPDAARHALIYAGYDQLGTEWVKVHEGVDYSALDYFAIAAHEFGIPAPGLRAFIADTGHMICSQLADQCQADAGCHLFTDGRWAGYVMPTDLGGLLGQP